MAKKSPEKSNSTTKVVRSMTGYGRVVEPYASGRLSAEIRSVNNRFLKLSIKVPGRFGSVEDKIKALLEENGVTRGSVDVGIFIESAGSSENGSGYEIDLNTAKTYAKQAKDIGRKVGISGSLSMDTLIGLPGVMKREEVSEDADAFWAAAGKTLLKALKQFEEMRGAEGKKMAEDVLGRVKELRAHRDFMAEQAPAVLEKGTQKIKERLAKKIEAVAAAGGNVTPLSQDNIEREVILLMDRTDISEEITRLGSHFEQMENALAAGGEVGKKLDFLTQELFRETNTIGSKTQDLGITHRVVDMKGIIEKIREQVQNLE